MRYLIAVDSSDNAKKAVEHALTIMSPESDFVVLLTVVEQISFFDEINLQENMIRDFRRQLEEKATETLTKYTKILTDANIPHDSFVRKGSAKEVICDEALNKSIDTIIIGRRGMNAVKRLFVGSTSEYCIQNAPCSVLVIKE